MIKVEDLELQIGGFKLGPLNFMIRKEEFLVILGPSGSGKTLFLETLAGVRMPLRGRVILKKVCSNPYPRLLDVHSNLSGISLILSLRASM